MTEGMYAVVRWVYRSPWMVALYVLAVMSASALDGHAGALRVTISFGATWLVAAAALPWARRRYVRGWARAVTAGEHGDAAGSAGAPERR